MSKAAMPQTRGLAAFSTDNITISPASTKVADRRSPIQEEHWWSMLDQLMPMHLCLNADGGICRIGPTLRKVLQVVQADKLRSPCTGAPLPFDAFFEVVRPRGVVGADLGQLPNGTVLNLRPYTARRDRDIVLRGGITALGEVSLLNLCFGTQLAEAVSYFGLSADDFSPTDTAPEMLFLMEAKSAAVKASQRLSRRLQSARIAAQEEALTDTLTGAKNRRAMEQELAFLCRTGAAFALIHLDLDHFKQVNDTHGHLAGDHVLKIVADRLSAQLRQSDMLVRYGGDEFVLILRGQIDPAQLRDVSQRFIDALECPIPYQSHTCTISASLGISRSVDYDKATPLQMLEDADSALYTSKRAGRGCANFHLSRV